MEESTLMSVGMTGFLAEEWDAGFSGRDDAMPSAYPAIDFGDRNVEVERGNDDALVEALDDIRIG